MPVKLPKKSLRWLVIVAAAVVMVNLIAGPRGFYALYKLHSSCQVLKDSIEIEKVMIDSLTLVEERLKSDPIYIERAARELLGVSRPGETVIKFVDRHK